MKDDIVKRYTNEGITVVWEPSKCSHSRLCVLGLPAVFNPRNYPWIKLEGGTSEEIVAQVRKCPSGALSLEGDAASGVGAAVEVTVKQGGPLLVSGALNIKLANGETTEKTGMTALCRCGASANKPYCDGSHRNIEFDH